MILDGGSQLSAVTFLFSFFLPVKTPLIPARKFGKSVVVPMSENEMLQMCGRNIKIDRPRRMTIDY